jgi:hypothetical protein
LIYGDTHIKPQLGGGGDWHYRSSHHVFSAPLLAFTAINQSFFMGTFFFIRGIFSSVALARNGPKDFAQQKLLKLGLPALIYTIVSVPVQNALLEMCLHHRLPKNAVISDHFDTSREEPGIRGPVWYLVLLCIFDCVYAGCSTLWKSSSADSNGQLQKHTASITSIRTSFCVAGIMICGLVSFLVRFRYPLMQVNPVLNLRIGYVPQYIFLYVFGLYADPVGINLLPRFTVRAILTSMGAVGLILHSPIDGGPEMLEQFGGGVNKQAAMYAFQNELVGYLLFSSSVHLFRSYCRSSWAPMTGWSYAMFLVHAPVSVAVEASMDSWLAGAVTKTVVVGTLNCLCTMGAAWLLKQVPGVGRAV